MIKKVKKIPKYDLGTAGVGIKNAATTPNLAGKINTRIGVSPPSTSGTGISGGIGAGQIAGAIGGAASGIASAFGIELGETGQIISGIGLFASNFGPVGQIAGAALQTIGAFTGGGGSVDETTGEVTESSGLTRWLGFGRSDKGLKAKSGRIKASNAAREQTQNILADYYNNPNVEVQPSVLAAEGGIMRTPVDALVSKGELIYNPVTQKLSQVPGSKGKPNRADDVFARLYEGDIVISNSPTMLMANGRTPAQNLMGMVDKYATGGTVKAREAIIKKVVNWLEANKTKPQEYAMYSDGTYYVEGQRAIKRNGKWWWNEGGKKDALGNMHYVPYKGSQTPSIEKPSQFKNVGITTHPELDFVASRHTRPNESSKVTNKQSNNKTVKKQSITETEKLTPEQIAESLRILDIGERHWLRGPINAKSSLYVPNGLTKENVGKLVAPPFTVLKPGESGSSDESDESTSSTSNGSNWQDTFYRTAVLTQPLWGWAETEPVQYTMRNAKYLPVWADPTPLLQAADQSYSIGRYDFENMGGSTGAYMAHSAQLASDRAKRHADAYKWQQDTQNKLIAQNIGIYNDWDKDRVSIMNNVYDKAAANRAAARNINRQNITAALSNYGQMLHKDDLFAKELRDNKLKTKMLEPFVKAVYENSDELMPMITQYGINKNIKKKQINS